MVDDDEQCDAGGEAARDGRGDEFDEVTKAGDAHEDLDDAGHEGGEDAAGVAALRHDQEDYRYEGCGGAGDLRAATAERGHDETAGDAAKEADGGGGKGGAISAGRLATPRASASGGVMRETKSPAATSVRAVVWLSPCRRSSERGWESGRGGMARGSAVT